MDEVLIDADILSEIVKAKDKNVLNRARLHLDAHGRFSFSPITYNEMMRGFRAVRASRQLASFIALAYQSNVLSVSMAVLDQAASLWAEAYATGQPRNDADLIIAAMALTSGRTLVTGNVNHFQWIESLAIDDWRH